jgi:hypothetical protein
MFTQSFEELNSIDFCENTEAIFLEMCDPSMNEL